jgi:hypothetical protein
MEAMQLPEGSLDAAQREGLAVVNRYKAWWEQYDRLTKGHQVDEVEPEQDTMDDGWSLFVVIGFLVACGLALVLIALVNRLRKKRQGASAQRSLSTLSLPPPYEVVVDEKEQLAQAEGLPSYREACPSPWLGGQGSPQ